MLLIVIVVTSLAAFLVNWVMVQLCLFLIESFLKQTILFFIKTRYIGEIINSKNERWEIQFKGAGKMNKF
jgi:hypothetical protein